MVSLSNYVVPYTNSFWINQVQTWIKAKYGDVGRFVYILELLEKDEPLYHSDQTYLFEKLEKYRFQQQFSHISSINKKVQSVQQLQLEYDFISEQIQIKQTELDEITSKTKSIQQLPTENYLISEQIQIKQTELDEITSKTKSIQQKQAEYDPSIEQIQIKQDKLQTLNKQIHIKTSNLEKKIHEKKVLLRSLREQCNKYEQQKNEAFLFVSKIKNDVEILQSKKTILDKKINTIKKALKVFDMSDNVR